MRCPSWTTDQTSLEKDADVQGCGYNAKAFPAQTRAQPRALPLLSAIEKPAELVVFADGAFIDPYPQDPVPVLSSCALAPPSSGKPLFHGRHNGWGNVLWADGHVKAMQPLYMEGAHSGRFPLSVALQRKLQVGFLDRYGKSTTNEFFELNPDAG